MADIEKLREKYETAEAARVKLDAEYSEKRVALREKYEDRLNKAGTEAAEAQKALCDAEATHALAGRDDLDDEGKRRLAESLGLTLPE